MIRRIFITGLVAIIPVIITIYVIVGLFQFADGILGKYINDYMYEYFGYEVPGLGIIISVLIIFLAGLLIKLSRMTIARAFERLFLGIPLVKSVYFPVKKMVDFLFIEKSSGFQEVVMVEYPRKGIYSIGFLTNKAPQVLSRKAEKKLYNVFIPFSPFPTTGFTVIVSEEEVIFLDVSVEEAVRLIVSGGMLSPDEKAQ